MALQHHRELSEYASAMGDSVARSVWFKMFPAAAEAPLARLLVFELSGGGVGQIEWRWRQQNDASNAPDAITLVLDSRNLKIIEEVVHRARYDFGACALELNDCLPWPGLSRGDHRMVQLIRELQVFSLVTPRDALDIRARFVSGIAKEEVDSLEIWMERVALCIHDDGGSSSEGVVSDVLLRALVELELVGKGSRSVTGVYYDDEDDEPEECCYDVLDFDRETYTVLSGGGSTSLLHVAHSRGRPYVPEGVVIRGYQLVYHQ
jgi:hypothetical protein